MKLDMYYSNKNPYFLYKDNGATFYSEPTQHT